MGWTVTFIHTSDTPGCFFWNWHRGLTIHNNIPVILVRGEATIRQLTVTQVLTSGVKHPRGYSHWNSESLSFQVPGAKKTLDMQFQMYWGMSLIMSGMMMTIWINMMPSYYLADSLTEISYDAEQSHASLPSWRQFVFLQIKVVRSLEYAMGSKFFANPICYLVC